MLASMNHFALLFHEFVNLLNISTITSYLLRNLPKNIFFLNKTHKSLGIHYQINDAPIDR